MDRKDYNEVKEKFELFTKTLKDRKVDRLDAVFTSDVKCYLSTAKAYEDGSQHTLFGIKNFILDMPNTDFFHTRICNYVCRMRDNEAQQSAHIVCLCGRYGKKEPLYFLFNMMFSNHWKKYEDGWKINEVRMDVIKEEGNFEEFIENWHFEDRLAKTYTGVHLPCISGEFDSPWARIPIADDVYTEEEKVADPFYRYAFGIDNLVFHEVEKAVCEDVISKIQPWGSMDKRTWITALKFHRQKDRHWGHCGKISDIIIEDEKAKMKIYRMCGHRQREHSYVYTNENVDLEHVCATYEIECRKIDGQWKIKECEYFLGLVELGKYTKEDKVII